MHEPDPSVGDWIASRLGPFGAKPGSLVPRGCEAYVRVLHPAAHADGRPARWTEVAAACGTTVHPTAQWWALAGAPSWGGETRWIGEAPSEGSLPVAELAAVVEVLAACTPGGAGAEVVAALWEGFGWIHGGGSASLLLAHTAADAPSDGPFGWRPAPPGFDPQVLAAPRLELPSRRYLLFRGSLGDVADEAGVPWPTSRERAWWPQSPNLLWPTDRSWCLATEIDLDSSVVGGPRALVDALLAHPDLEVLEVREDDSFMVDGDAINA